MQEDDKNKERAIAQFKVPITKNCQLTAYQGRPYSQNGYESDFIANTQNLEGTFVIQADTEFDTNVSFNSNGEIEYIPSSELTVNAASSKSILQK